MTSNTSNTSNSGNIGAAGGGLSGFLPDRVDLPFASVPDPLDGTRPQRPLSGLRLDPAGGFSARAWAAEWSAWHVLADFTGTNWKASIDAAVAPPPDQVATDAEIDALVLAALDERADALGEILSQDGGFRSEFLGLLAISQASHPATYRLLRISDLVGTFVVMHVKNVHQRRRPSHACPALKPPIPVPGHASYPSGHATQANLMALCLAECVKSALPPSEVATVTSAVTALAARIGRNREIAGLHYPSDTRAGELLAGATFRLLNGPDMPIEANNRSRFANAVFNAALEWA